MTYTEQLRRALRAYDIAGPKTPDRAAALAAVLSAAHGICTRVCTYCAGSGKADGRECICQVIGLPPEPTPNAALANALALCVESLDQLLPYLGKVPADIGLLNDALVSARPTLAAYHTKAPSHDQ